MVLLEEFNEETEQLFNDFEEQIKDDICNSPIIYSCGKKVLIEYYFYLIFLNILKKFDKFNISVISINFLKDYLKNIFNQKKNTELYGIDFIDINKLVYNYCDIDIYNDLIIFMKKNNIYRNSNLEKFIKNL